MGEHDKKKVPWWTSTRLGLAVIGFFGFMTMNAQRISISVAMVCMVNHTALRVQRDAQANGVDNMSNASAESSQLNGDQCGVMPANATVETDGPFVWGKSVQGLIFGSFFIGYLVFQFPGGILSTRFGGKIVFTVSMAAMSIATILVPFGSRLHYGVVMLLRGISGMGAGCTYPAMHALWGYWAPPLERSKLAGIAYAGPNVGNVLTLPFAGFLCEYGFDGGWPSIFYLLGALGIIWVIVWWLLVTDNPGDHPRISSAEQQYILKSLQGQAKIDKKDMNIPWRAILTSPAVWAIVIANVSCDWGLYTFETNTPTYMKEVLKFDIKSNGLFSSLPYICQWVAVVSAGITADAIRSRGLLNTTWTRKLMEGIGKMIPAVVLLGLGFLDCTRWRLAVALLCLSVGIYGTQFSSFVVNHVDIAPKYAGILMGITNSIGAGCGFFAPLVVGIITSEQTRQQWQTVFFITSAVLVAGCTLYFIMGSGELQDWAKEEVPVTAELDPIDKVKESEGGKEQIAV